MNTPDDYLPPPLHQNQPATPPPAGPPPPNDPPGIDDDAPADVPGAKPKADWGKRVADNKLLVLGGLLVLLFGGLGFWWLSLTNQAAHMSPSSPVSAGEIDNMTTKPHPPETVDPMSATEQSLARDQTHSVEVSADTMLANGVTRQPGQSQPPASTEQPRTVAQREDYRTQMAMAGRANNTDSITVTRRDPHTGQFVQTRVATQRVPLSTGQSSPAASRPLGTGRRRAGSSGGGGGYYRQPQPVFSAVTPQNQAGFSQPARTSAEPPRPTRDTDGTPFETNDEINMMIAGLPESVQQQYEKMSGKRYRPLTGSQQQQSSKDRRTEMAYVPGMDGFNTIRYRGQNASPEDETPEVPDIFYRCTIQGTQQVRTGSVVVLRLTEDATFNGVTFPRNMTFSALASVDVNRVNLLVDHLGPHRVKVQTFNYAYMPGIMIDPGKRAPTTSNQSIMSGLQQSSTAELSNAIAQSQQAANSLTGVGGRMAVTLLGRLPKAGAKLKQVTLPDGYPLLLSKAQQGGAIQGAVQQAGINTTGGLQGQDGNPFQSLLMSGQGVGGYQGATGVVPPLYYPVPVPIRRP